jgi:hypothetical protein
MVKARLLASIIDLWHCIGLLALLTSFILGIGKDPEGLALPSARTRQGARLIRMRKQARLLRPPSPLGARLLRRGPLGARLLRMRKQARLLRRGPLGARP